MRFAKRLVKILGPYDRLFVESIENVGTRISFVVYKEGIAEQNGPIKPYQFKNENFDLEMAFFNPKDPSATNSCVLADYIQSTLLSLNLDNSKDNSP